MYYGRRKIHTKVKEITAANVRDVVMRASRDFSLNLSEIEYLYRYYKGYQDILWTKEKVVRPEINNIVVANIAAEIVAFCKGYRIGEPIQYVNRKANQGETENITRFNEYMIECDGASKNADLVEWQMICGTAYKLVLPNATAFDDESPFKIISVDPRSAFVIYSTDIDEKPVAGVYVTQRQDKDGLVNTVYSVYTRDRYYEICGDEPIKEERHDLERIPIIEYPANNARLGAFEIVLPLLNAINDTESNRRDAIEQFVQSLLVFTNCELGEDEDGNPITPQQIRDYGAIFLKSNDGNRSDLKQIADELNQTETQTLVDNYKQMIREIVGMPSQSDGTTGDSSNNGAVIFKTGWQGAETRAKDWELSFLPCEREAIRLMLHICNTYQRFDMKVSDIDIKFTRRQYDNLQVKSQVLTTMLANPYIAPIDAYVTSTLFSDPEDACERGLKWYEASKETKVSSDAEQEETETETEETENEE